MLLYTARRGLQTIPVVLGVVALVFLMMRFLPGDPAAYILGEGAQQSAIEALRDDLGLNDPMHVQFWDFFTRVITFDLGTRSSTAWRSPKSSGMHCRRRLRSAVRAWCSVSSSQCHSGRLPRTTPPRARTGSTRHLTGSALLMDVVPAFLLALVLMLVFTLNLGWFPATGSMEWSDPFLLVKRLALPVIVLTLAQVGIIARVTRTAVLEIMSDDFVRTARAMGTPGDGSALPHALRNAALPVVTVAGLSFGRLLSGTVIVESIFALPGMGTVLVNSIMGRDYPVVQGVVLVYATIFILVNLLTDLSYTKLDPRVRL
jgi:peptide/nickel transport system permease protein